MLKKQIREGGIYVAKVSNKLTTVRVDTIRATSTMAGRDTTTYDCTNQATGRKVSFRSAAKFRREAGKASAGPKATNETKRKTVKPTVAAVVMGQLKEQRETQSTLASLLRKAIANMQGTDTDTAPHLIVEARAGTGKTTTLIEGLKRVKGIPSDLTPSPQQAAVWESMALSAGKAKTIAFVAFNKSIAEELKNRVPAGCDAMTNHGMGFRAVNKAYKPVRVNEYRVADIIAELLETPIRDLRKDKPILVKATQELVGLCKMNLTGIGDLPNDPSSPPWHPVAHPKLWDEMLTDLAAYYEVDCNGFRKEIFALVPRVLERCKDVSRDGCIDFDDMIWIPVVNNLPVFQYDLLLVDEAQDLNRCQQALVKRAGKRIILCGDPKQAIYGFAGADAESMPRMARELSGIIGTGRSPSGIGNNTCVLVPMPLKCVTLPLTVTRRCGKAIVAEAQKIVPDFDAFPTNPEGEIRESRYSNKNEAGREIPGVITYHDEVREGDMLLCRVNSPLVSQCFRFLRAGRKANIQGRDIGQGLISTITKLKANNVADLIAKVSEWLESETAKERVKKNPSEARLIALEDRHDCLMAFANDATSVDGVISRIESIFTDNKQGVGIRLSSIHKAKGLEARRVFFLQPKGAECPHPLARSDWQRQQENNLRYVAVTRAIETLVYVY